MDENRRRDLEDMWNMAINMGDIPAKYKEKNQEYTKEIKIIEMLSKFRQQDSFSKYLEGDRDERLNKAIDVIEEAVKKYDETEAMNLNKYYSLLMEAIHRIEKRKREAQEECTIYTPKKERNDDDEGR